MADPMPYFAASAVSSVMTFPLWKAAAIGQSGYALKAKSVLGRLREAAMPPYRGSLVVVSGRAWAQAAIFFGSDEGSRWLRRQGWNAAVSSSLPPLVISANVSIANQPFVRSSIMLQGDPQVSFAQKSSSPTIAVIRHLWKTEGAGSLWLGTGVGIVRTVPKYVTAVVAKDFMEDFLPSAHAGSSTILRSAMKSMAASLVGAVLTNPLDVLQNEMYKSGQGVLPTLRRLRLAEGRQWLLRGCGSNAFASAMPMALTIFLTDAFTQWRHNSFF